jgi:hypothetical protein
MARSQYEQSRIAVAAYNDRVRAANKVISHKKEATRTVDIKAAEMAFIRLKATKARHELEPGQACAAYETGKIAKVDQEKERVREKLETYTTKVIRPYEQRINELLDDFNAGFRIAEMAHTNPGGIATSSYRLVINNMHVDLGDGKTPLNRPSFKNTLSSGDRSTLALAFFLAALERDPNRQSRIVVFDDPMNSQDAFRRRQTIHEINKTARHCAQVIVLSHDPRFLRQIWEKSPPEERVAVQLADHRALGTKITSCDLDEVCKGRAASEIDDLQAYLSTNAGFPRDLIKKMRIVLETHCRSTYSGYFEPTDRLGGMVEKIKKMGDQHPAWSIHEQLELVNEYSRDHHHGEDPTDSTLDQIDPIELTGFVRRTLRLANNLQG